MPEAEAKKYACIFTFIKHINRYLLLLSQPFGAIIWPNMEADLHVHATHLHPVVWYVTGVN